MAENFVLVFFILTKHIVVYQLALLSQSNTRLKTNETMECFIDTAGKQNNKPKPQT